MNMYIAGPAREVDTDIVSALQDFAQASEFRPLVRDRDRRIICSMTSN